MIFLLLFKVLIISPFLQQKPKYSDKWESLVNRLEDQGLESLMRLCFQH